MSSSAYGTVMVGVKVEVETRPCVKTHKRFDPLTGAPLDLHSESFDIRLIFDGTPVSLPDDPFPPLEDDPERKLDYDKIHWFIGREERRIQTFLRDKKIAEERLDPGEGELTAVRESWDLITVGHVLGSGSNYVGYGDDESLVEIDLSRLSSLRKKIRDHLRHHLSVDVTPKVYLSVRLG